MLSLFLFCLICTDLWNFCLVETLYMFSQSPTARNRSNLFKSYKNSIKQVQSQASLNYAERENFI